MATASRKQGKLLFVSLPGVSRFHLQLPAPTGWRYGLGGQVV